MVRFSVIGLYSSTTCYRGSDLHESNRSIFLDRDILHRFFHLRIETMRERQERNIKRENEESYNTVFGVKF